jgi:hypothetical protein
MNRRIISLLLIIIVGILLNCDNPNKELQLEILNNEVYAYYLGSEFNNEKRDSLSYDAYEKNGYSQIKFKIRNPTKNPILFFPICIERESIGCSSILSYPDKFKNIGLGNLIVTDNQNNLIEPDFKLVSRIANNEFKYDFIRDSLNVEYYNKIGYEKKTEKWKFINSEFINKAIVIHPNETIFFDSYLRLATNLDGYVHDVFYDLNKSKSYKIKLKFKSDFDNLNNWLTDYQIKNIEENNYDIFQGELYSENEIPIVFKKLVK